MVDNRVYGDGGFAGLAVADDQFALAFADRHHRVNGFNTGLQGLFNGLAVNDTGGHNIKRHIFIRVQGSFAVQCLAQRVDYTADDIRPHGDADNFAGAFHHAALFDLRIRPHQHTTDVVILQVHRHTFDAVTKIHQFGGLDVV